MSIRLSAAIALVHLAAPCLASSVSVLCGSNRYARIQVTVYDNDAAIGTTHKREYRGTAVFDPLDGTKQFTAQTKSTDWGGSIEVMTVFSAPPGLPLDA